MMALKGRKTHFSFSSAPIWAREGFAKKLLFFKGDVLQLQTDTRDGERRAVRPKIGVRPKRETAAGFKSQLDIRRPLLLTFAERKISKHNVQRPTALMFRNGRLAVGAGCWQMTKVDRKGVWKKPNKLFWSSVFRAWKTTNYAPEDDGVNESLLIVGWRMFYVDNVNLPADESWQKINAQLFLYNLEVFSSAWYVCMGLWEAVVCCVSWQLTKVAKKDKRC